MVKINRRVTVFVSLLIMFVLVFYLQITYNKEEIIDKDMKTELTRDVVNSKAPTFVQSGSFEQDDFFSKAKLDREISQSKTNEVINDIIEKSNVSPQIKEEAMKKMDKLVKEQEVEVKIETLIKEKGFSDAFVACGEDGSIDIIVKAPSLTGTEVAQIADIASRHADVEITKIHIKNKY